MWFRRLVLWTEPGTFHQSLVITLVVVVLSMVAVRGAWTADGAVMLDGHAVVSLDLALARAYCGHGSAYSSTIRIPVDVAARMERRYVPLRTLIEERADSLDAYCRSVDTPFVNSENSLMLLESALLRMVPGLSLADLGQALHLIRIAGLVVFVMLLIDLGASLALAFSTMLSGLLLLESMPDHVYSNYPFLFAMVLVLVALHGFAVKYQWFFAGAAGVIMYGAFAGMLSAFVVHMRTSYLPVVVLFALLVLWYAFSRCNDTDGWTHRALRCLAWVGCVVVAYGAFQTALITRHLPDEGRFSASHPFAHPLVLALGVPETDFSRENGIRWADEVGPQIAARVDPEVTFLGPGYDAALLRYYASLWESDPGGMVRLYYLKFSVFGADMFRAIRGSPGLSGWAVNLLLAPLALLSAGVGLLVVYGAVTLLSLAAFRRSGHPAAFVLGLLTLAALLVHVEAGLIFSLFVKQYHNYAVFYAIFVSVLGLQALANAAVTLVSRGTRVA